jgi:hypothetical protein
MPSAPKLLWLLAIILGLPFVLSAADAKPAAPAEKCTSAESKQLDFWLGDWSVSGKVRTAPDKDEWEDTKGENRIRKILGGCVIEESFTSLSGDGFVGRSLSTFDARTKGWKQTWVDNEATYLDFTGRSEPGGRFVFEREAKTPDGKPFRQRMVFHDATKDALVWDWERSDDGGTSWKRMWRLDYRRKK